MFHKVWDHKAAAEFGFHLWLDHTDNSQVCHAIALTFSPPRAATNARDYNKRKGTELCFVQKSQALQPELTYHVKEINGQYLMKRLLITLTIPTLRLN